MKRNGNLSFEYFEHDKIWIMYDKEEYKKLIIITWTLIKVYWYISKGLKGGNNGFSMEKNEKYYRWTFILVACISCLSKMSFINSYLT